MALHAVLMLIQVSLVIAVRGLVGILVTDMSEQSTTSCLNSTRRLNAALSKTYFFVI
jgi:hypothetical protein